MWAINERGPERDRRTDLAKLNRIPFELLFEKAMDPTHAELIGRRFAGKNDSLFFGARTFGIARA